MEMPEGAGWDLESVLREQFGLETFRPLQREIIAEVLSGRPAMAILPTGGGKSLCYQLPALTLPGVTLVISPLISLMKDQVDALVSRSIPAVAINSQDTAAEGRAKLEALASGKVKLAFVAPERLTNTAFLSACRRVTISLLAVDEAHCVSQWGHDFRPDYRYIKEFHAAIGAPPLLALTATARPDVRDDALVQLGIQGCRVFSASADRQNLYIGLETCATVAEKRAKVALLTRTTPGSVIIYVSSRKEAEGLAGVLTEHLGEQVAAYHGGMSPSDRTAVQNQFMAGLCRVVVATNAFGMGIDKPDIRAVIHAGVPDSLEAYFQEIGRAGRDGLPSVCVMVLVPGMDVKVREFLLRQEQAGPGALEALFRRVQAAAAQTGGLLAGGRGDETLMTLVVSYLQSAGHVELLSRSAEGLEIAANGLIPEEAFSQVRRAMAAHERTRQERFRRMRSFVYLTDQCRRQYLLQYFGEQVEPQAVACCSFCDPRPLPEEPGVPTRKARQKKDRTAAQPPVEAGSTPAAAEALFERLREWRRAKAAAMSVPAFVVFGDKDLRGVAEAAPQTLNTLAACRGLGPVKLRQYGEEILAVVAGATAAPPEPARLAHVLPQAQALFAEGHGLAEVADRLKLPRATLFEALLDWVEADVSGLWKQAVRPVISQDEYRAIRRELWAHPGVGLTAVFLALDERYTFEQIRLARVVLARAGD